MSWTKTEESRVMQLRSEGRTYVSIADELGRSAVSVKHKVRRLQQDDNQDRYKHTDDKVSQIKRFIDTSNLDQAILETHAGFGCLTEFYSNFGSVDAFDIKKDRIDEIDNKHLEGVTTYVGDSENEIQVLSALNSVYDIVDIDPYGLPSRYFPYAFKLIENGLLFLTFPMMGVAQINKITIRHYQAFWGIELEDKDCYIEKIISRLRDYAFMHKREIEVLDVVKIDRIFRLAIKVEKKSMLDIVGLEVKRKNNG